MTGWIFNSLSRHTAIWIKKWNRDSIDKKRLSALSIEKLMGDACERPFLVVILICLISINFSIWLGWTAVKSFGLASPIPFGWETADQLTFFSTLWTLQGTIAALVYPIVIAFVAVLLQRNATAKLSLRLYIQDASVIPAGASAIALLLWMGLQYIAVNYAFKEWIAGAMIGNSVWFILNILLTSWFLYRTVRFLNDDERHQIFTRFAVRVAFPQEVRQHLLGNIFSHAQSLNLISGKEYTDIGPGPKVLLFPISEGNRCITVRCKRKQIITDIHFRLLDLGVKFWLRKTKKSTPPLSVAGQNLSSPLLVIPIALGETVDGEVVVCRVKDANPPGFWASLFIRHSVVFGSSPRSYTSYSCSEIMEELAVETLALAEQKRIEAAGETMVKLADLHGDLVRSGAFINDNGEHDNAALLPSPYGFGSLPIHLGWLHVYRKIAEFVARELPLDSSLYKRYCYLASRIIDSAEGCHLGIAIHVLHIPIYLMYQLGIWWADKVEERGLVVHDVLHAVTLPHPLGRIYDRALQTFIEGWEAICIWGRNEQSSIAAEVWAKLSRHALFSAALAEKTAEMLLGAIARGDKIAALWLVNSFLLWWERIQHHFDRNQSCGVQDHFLTFSCVRKKWSEVRNIVDGVPEGQQEGAQPGVIISIVLRRYWSDLRLVIILILLDWTPADAPRNTFTIDLAIALLQGCDLKHDNLIVADGLEDPRTVLFGLLRLQLADRDYTQMFDNLVDYAQKLRAPRMIAGRIHTSTWSGPNNVETLYLAQNQLLGAIVNTDINCKDELTEIISRWAKDLRQLQRCKRLAEKLSECIGFGSLREKFPIIAVMRERIGLPDNVDKALDLIGTTWHDLKNLAEKTNEITLNNAQVSERRLNEICRKVTAFIQGDDNKVFPFSFLSMFVQVSDDLEPRSQAFSGIRKEPYTDPPLEQESLSYLNFFNENIAKSISVGLISDYVRSTNTKPLRTDTKIIFFEDLTIRAEEQRKKGLTPILIIPERNNLKWLSPWRYQKGMAEETGVSFQLPVENDDFGVIGYFNYIPTYRAPLVEKNCYVLPREKFNVIYYNAFTPDSFISVIPKPEDDNKIRLEFEWRFHSVKSHSVI